VGVAGWLARLEYSRVVDQEEIGRCPDRALSIVANDLNGRPVITVKGSDEFDVEFPGSLSPRVRRIRQQLEEIAEPPIPGLARDQWNYAFGRVPGAGPNAGDDATLEGALISLAESGWALYSQIISRANRERLARKLEEKPDGVIHVAHVLISKVIPWSLIYDRYFTRNEQTDKQGNPVQPAACLAALPDPNGVFHVSRCKEHPDCLLHSRSPDSVACPLRFWGLSHWRSRCSATI
jgi:hypothetical protein